MKLIFDRNVSVIIGFMFASIITVYLDTLPSVGQVAWQYSLTFLLTDFGITFVAILLGAAAALAFYELFKSLSGKDEKWSE